MMNNPNTTNTNTLLPADIVLTADDIVEFGIEEAPDDAGPSFEEMAVTQGGRFGHG
jgi:hypothetical protein